jgi:hypothetical protein
MIIQISTIATKTMSGAERAQICKALTEHLHRKNDRDHRKTVYRESTKGMPIQKLGTIFSIAHVTVAVRNLAFFSSERLKAPV